jgi:hypothetical protein
MLFSGNELGIPASDTPREDKRPQDVLHAGRRESVREIMKRPIHPDGALGKTIFELISDPMVVLSRNTCTAAG